MHTQDDRITISFFPFSHLPLPKKVIMFHSFNGDLIYIYFYSCHPLNIGNKRSADRHIDARIYFNKHIWLNILDDGWWWKSFLGLFQGGDGWQMWEFSQGERFAKFGRNLQHQMWNSLSPHINMVSLNKTHPICVTKKAKQVQVKKRNRNTLLLGGISGGKQYIMF